MATRSEVEATIRSEEYANVPIQTYHSLCYSLLARAESAERALALSEQIRSISVRADAYEQKCRELNAATKHIEAAEIRLSSIIERIESHASEVCYCDELIRGECEHCEFLQELHQFLKEGTP